MMKTVIATAIAAAFALPAFAQTSNLPDKQERAQNREKVQDKLPSAEERAGNRLASDAGMRTMTNIDGDSEDGVVTLKGKVDSADAKKKAEAIAKKVDGVKRVKNELKVEAKKSS